ncbi:hypothetical protein Egran_04023 [Elaphomyces granulatus]|uniref:Uncharacterized protein n=1 Tax=Elaphomyces granulatus TaxID=519963 RepID=A0A232LVS6_9EURO|nr:hypothetical protein Egran_04023 [Elaphomyces granulatus]
MTGMWSSKTRKTYVGGKSLVEVQMELRSP